ncbi:MAG: nucleoside transporter C-terminal domain-containing protein [Planctomycetota bacterium]
MLYVRAMLGIAIFIFLAWAISSNRKRFPWRIVVVGLMLQVGLGALILNTDIGYQVFQALGQGFVRLLDFSIAGSSMVFGDLGSSDGSAGFIFAFAGNGLVAIIFFSALLAVLYHLGIMQAVIWVLARIMSKLMGVSGAESLAMAANIFAGQTEAPLAIRPYLSKLTMSELNAMMTGGFATIAGSVLAVYLGFIGEEYAPHLLTASVLSAPAAFLIAKVMLPETETSQTGGHVPFKVERQARNTLEAATIGTQEGLKLWLNVIAMLIAFVALVALIDWPLGLIGEYILNPIFAMPDNPIYTEAQPLSLAMIFGTILAPLAWVIGIDGWHDCQWFGSLLGIKLAVNEFVAFLTFSSAATTESLTMGFRDPRHATMAAYALCGFANFASIGIQIGGISSLVPERRADLAKLATRAMLGGAFASWMTATVAGMFIN